MRLQTNTHRGCWFCLPLCWVKTSFLVIYVSRSGGQPLAIRTAAAPDTVYRGIYVHAHGWAALSGHTVPLTPLLPGLFLSLFLLCDADSHSD